MSYDFSIRKTRGISPMAQIILVIAMTLAMLCFCWIILLEGATPFGLYPSSNFRLSFAPIYEELFFRGIVFSYLYKRFSLKTAIIWSSILFGLRHLKNIFYTVDMSVLLTQILYTGLVFGPIMAYIYYRTKNIWICVILHAFNNLGAALFFLYG